MLDIAKYHPFTKLNNLLAPITPKQPGLNLSIGEPKFDLPDWTTEIFNQYQQDWKKYPPLLGMPEYLDAYRGWVKRRFNPTVLNDTASIATAGSREGLYLALQYLLAEKPGYVLVPDPYYHVYVASTVAFGGKPYFVPTDPKTFLPNYDAVPDDIWQQTSGVILCNPTVPQGGVASTQYLGNLLGLIQKHNVPLCVDECYIDLYRDQEPTGILSVAKDPKNLMIFHSLSKRSNAAGMRCGAITGDPDHVSGLSEYVKFGGGGMGVPVQQVATKLWQDDNHVIQNRHKYNQNCVVFSKILNTPAPPAGFFGWLPVDDDIKSCQYLWAEHGIRTIPGSYLTQNQTGQKYLRLALVYDHNELTPALEKLIDL